MVERCEQKFTRLLTYKAVHYMLRESSMVKLCQAVAPLVRRSLYLVQMTIALRKFGNVAQVVSNTEQVSTTSQ